MLLMWRSIFILYTTFDSMHDAGLPINRVSNNVTF